MRGILRTIAGLAILLVADAQDAGAEWLRAESPHFIVYGQSSERTLREQAATLEDFDTLLRALTGTRAPPSPNKLSVYMVRGIGQLRDARPGLSASVGGFYLAQSTGVAAFVDERAQMGLNPSDDTNMQVLFHEYAHHFMLQYFPAAYPPWYIEGFAEFMMYTRLNGPVIEYGRVAQARGMWLTQMPWVSLDRVLFESQSLRNENVSMFYAQSWILVHYLFRDPERRAALGAYLTAYGRGDDPREAFQTAFNMRPGQMEAALRRYIGGRGIPVTRLTRASVGAPPPIQITRLPASADDLLLLDAGLRLGVPEDERVSYLARVRRLAGDHPGDPFATRVLARAEVFLGDDPTAESLLTPLIAAAPGDAELLYLLGMRHLNEANRAEDPSPHSREAQRLFVRAHRADGNHVPTLFAYAESLRSEDNYVSENTSNILVRALQLAPQVQSIRLNAAVMLMNREQFAAAEALIQPLLADPHAPGYAQPARDLLAQARAGQKPGNLRIGENDDPAGGSDGGGDDTATDMHRDVREAGGSNR